MKTMEKSRVLCATILVSIICMTITGCGKVADKDDLLSYASEKYGKCSVIDEETSDKECTIVLEDEEYGFEYLLSSSMDKIMIDGADFGSTPTVKSDFTENYLQYFTENFDQQIRAVENNYDCVIEINKYYDAELDEDILLYLSADTGNYKDALNLLCAYIKDYDTRRFLKNGVLYIKQNDECIGKYFLKDEIYKDIAECDIEWALSRAFEIMKNNQDVDIDKADELTFLYSEVLDVNDIYGIQNETLAYRMDDTPESLKSTTVWHYSYQDEEWIIADCIVQPYGNLYVHKLQK